MKDLIGHTLDHYRIVEKIGAGGMGEVYRAHDTRLDRDVAIKVLPEDVASDQDRLARFKREARAVAKLSHPNILAIYELGEHENRPFIVTELLEGQSLREILDTRRVTSWKAIEYAKQIAYGLAAAHERDIVHRDLKPANVFITSDGMVKILDFGLAKLIQPVEAGAPGSESLTMTRETGPGKVMGTVSYMSPEQVRAENIDHRSDIFSLGIVLHEMLAGQRPFRAASSAEIMTAIARENAPLLSAIDPEILPSIERIVTRCLEKRPEDRFQSARDLSVDLQGILRNSSSQSQSQAPAAAPPQRSYRWPLFAAIAAAALMAIVAFVLLKREPVVTEMPPESVSANTLVAVLPFENHTGDETLGHLGASVAQQIGDGLTETEVADVVPALTLRRTPGSDASDETPFAAAKATGAGTIVSGTYAVFGDHLTFNATVMDAVEERLLYTLVAGQEIGEAPTEAIARLREKVMAAVAVHLSWDSYLRFTKEPPLWAAYREYVLYLDFWESDTQEAIRHLRRAVELDPEFLGAWLKLATAYWNLGEWATSESMLEPVREARVHLTPSGRKGLAGLEARAHGNLQERLRLHRETLRLEPDDPRAAYSVANYAQKTNRPQEALDLIATINLADYSTINLVALKCEAHHMLGEYEQEFETALQGRDLFPQIQVFPLHEACALAALGRLDELEQVVDQATSLHDDPTAAGISSTTGDLMITVASELRADGYLEESLNLAQRAVEWHRLLAPERAQQERYRSGLAWALYLAGEWDESKVLFEELSTVQVEHVSNATDLDLLIYQGVLGVLAARTGDREAALAVASDLAAITGYTQGWNTYLRACISAQLEEKDEAVELLRRAFADGLQMSLDIHRDIDLEPLWDYPSFQELIRPKG